MVSLYKDAKACIQGNEEMDKSFRIHDDVRLDWNVNVTLAIRFV